MGLGSCSGRALGREAEALSLGATKCHVPAGIQRQSAYCTEWQAGPVDDRYCDPVGRPDDRQRKCSEEPCPAR